MKPLKLAVLILTIQLVACATKGPVSINPSHEEMSLALRTMALTGNDKYFVDVDNQYFDEETLNGTFNSETPVFDILTSVGFYSDTLSGIGNSTSLISNNLVGTLQLAITLLESEKVNRQRLDRTVFAWIPKDRMKTKSEAIQHFADTLIRAVAERDGINVSDIKVVRVTEHGLNGWRLYTSQKMYVEGHGIVEQGHFEKTGAPYRAWFFIDDVWDASGDPKNFDSDSFYLKASFNVYNANQVDQEKNRMADLIEISRLMPNWYYQFVFIDKVPVVLHSKKLNFFIKPQNEESTRQASTSSSL